MVMSIISSLNAATLIIISVLGLVLGECYRGSCGELEVNTFHVIELLAGMVAIPTTIISSVLSCKATCCREKMDTPITPLKVMYSTGEGGFDPQPILRQAMQFIQGEQSCADCG